MISTSQYDLPSVGVEFKLFMGFPRVQNQFPRVQNLVQNDSHLYKSTCFKKSYNQTKHISYKISCLALTDRVANL
jgi:hypothetical protein